MIGPQQGGGALDLQAVQRDDDLLAALGSRVPVDLDDPAAGLLASLVADVDDGLSELLAADGPDLASLTSAGQPDDEGPAEVAATGPRPRSRRRTAYGAVTALALGATLSVSGVAAAVTGDPLSPYKAVGAALSWGADDLPPNAAEVAHLNKRLAGARAAIARGEVTGAQAKIDALRSSLAGLDLNDGQRAAFERKLDRLEAAVAGDGTSPGKGAGPSGPKADTGKTAPQDKADKTDKTNTTGKTDMTDTTDKGNGPGTGSSRDDAGPSGGSSQATPGTADSSNEDSQDGKGTKKNQQSKTTHGNAKGTAKGTADAGLADQAAATDVSGIDAGDDAKAHGAGGSAG